MKKKILMACAALVVSAAAVLGVKAYNYYSMPELMRANLEALTNPESDEQIPDYKNVVDKTTTKEFRFKTDVDTTTGGSISSGSIEIEYEVSCVVYHTYCKSAKGKTCYTSLNGTRKECDE